MAADFKEGNGGVAVPNDVIAKGGNGGEHGEEDFFSITPYPKYSTILLYGVKYC